VHVHDIPWPFEYWRHWVAQGRYWNEGYLLRALLTDNPKFRMLWFSSYRLNVHRDRMNEMWPEFEADRGSGASLWMVTA
jgi:hypothetical protein